MNNKQVYKTISKHVVVKNKWTAIIKENFKTSTGNTRNYLIVERLPALMIIPIIKKKNKNYTYLVKQFRYPIAKEVWQFPMGTLDNNADPKEHAKKELKEETGLVAKSLTFLGSYYVDPGLSRQQCYIYIAKGITEGGEQKLEETEIGMVAQKFSIEELNKLVADNQEVDGWIYSGHYFLKKFLEETE